ncbi:MAG: ROK family protein [Actinomycetota bacterium]
MRRGGRSTGREQTFAAGTPSLLRAINERTVLERIRRLGPVSRAQIARDSGLSKPTVSQALTSLESARLVREAGRSSGGKGPTALLYELNPHAGWVVGLDVGRDWVRAAIADLTGEIVARTDERARARSAGSLIAQVGGTAHALAAQAGIRWRDVTYAVVGSPGVFLESRNQVALAHNLPGWGRQGLVEALQEELGTKVAFENDVNLAALGERWKGLGSDVEDFVYLHVGTGVGMGIVVNGALYRGAHGAAGEVGYLPLVEDPHAAKSRRRGTLEGALGSAAVIEAGRRQGLPGPLTVDRLFAAAARGDVAAGRAVATIAERVALAISAIAPVLDPELVILGGGTGRHGDVLLGPVRAELHALSPFAPRVEVSPLAEDAELIGAVSFALEAAQDQLFARAEAKGGIAV